MGPRGDHNREEFLALVLDAAEAIARDEGLRGLGMRRIAAAIGYAPNSIYNAIGGLDDIVLRLNARTLTRLSLHLEAIYGSRRAATLDPVDEIQALAAGYLDFVLAAPKLWGLLFEHAMPHLTVFPDWYQEALNQPTALVETALGTLVPERDARRRSVAALWAALHGLASLATSGKLGVVGRDDPHTLARHLIGTYLAGIVSQGSLTGGQSIT